jgi:hypothetical protein
MDAARADWMPPPSEDYRNTHPGWETKQRGTPHGKLVVYTVADLDTAEPRGYILKGLLSPGEFSLWVGAPKCGKSFLLLHVAYLLSLGTQVFGRRVKQVVVLYVAAEGEGGINNRIEALRRKHGDSKNFHFIAQPVDLLNPAGNLADLKDAIAAIKPDLIVIDTVSRALAGGDENSPEHMGTFVKHIGELRHETGAHVAAVHHGTKNSNGTNPRGHSSLTGADDVLVEVTKHDDGSRTARVVHAKDDTDGHQFAFALEQVVLGEDEDGDRITTLIVAEAGVAAPKPLPEKLSNNEANVLNCLQKAINADRVLLTVGQPPAERAAVTIEQWRHWFYTEGMPGVDIQTKGKTFRRAVEALQRKGRIASENDYVWTAPRT